MKRTVLLFSLCIVLVVPVPGRPGPFQVPADARDIFDRALTAESGGRPDEALDLFWQAHGRSASVLTLDDGGMLDRLTTGLQRRISDDPTDAPSRFRLAELLALRGLIDEALSHYTAVAADTVAPETLRRLASQQLPVLRRRSTDLASLAATAAASTPAPQVVRLTDDNQYLVGRLHDLMAENNRLRDQVASLEEGVAAARKETEQARAEAEKVRQAAKDWKLYYHLFWANPDNYRTLRPGARFVP